MAGGELRASFVKAPTQKQKHLLAMAASTSPSSCNIASPLFTHRLLQRPPSPPHQVSPCPLLHRLLLRAQLRPRQSARPWEPPSRRLGFRPQMGALPSSGGVELGPGPWLTEPPAYVIHARPDTRFHIPLFFSSGGLDPASASEQPPAAPHPSLVEVPSPLQEPEIGPPLPPDASPASAPEEPIPTIPTELPAVTPPPEVSPPPPPTPPEVSPATPPEISSQPTPLEMPNPLHDGSPQASSVTFPAPPIIPPSVPPLVPPGVPPPIPPPQTPPINPPGTPPPIPPPQTPPIPPGSPYPVPPPTPTPIPTPGTPYPEIPDPSLPITYT